ncbi:zinc-binding oxidoreductase [Grosmannia clavigera kw1407]|uniref:Zinc-binding oxidoreductase n=1 Tax=Grosmannia clavigera (strain kw1407 / UAMH 11150) TaxID=655863 RepID=F0XL54_GROCL|nr:zinc-binding oxidoreductase [Grosmannia clavigera kw1407]EFX01768.1 zinc-binding oxidoreductase [Grosmannia clavigera kw1407]
MKAVVVDGNQCRVDYEHMMPQLHDYHVLVKPVAVALNPTDWRHLRYGRAKNGCIVGCDYAGVVEFVGRGVTKAWSPGDRIFGCAHGANLANPDDGVFAEFAAVVGDLQMRIPDEMDFTDAATLGLGSITVGQGLFQKALKLDLPALTIMKKEIPVLIYGGGTATGALAIQYARHLGADFAVDYHDADAGAQIREYTNNNLFHAWDTVSVPQSAQICADALSTQKHQTPIYGTVLPIGSPRADVETVSTVMYTVFGKEFKFGPVVVPASKEDLEFGKTFSALTEALVAGDLL